MAYEESLAKSIFGWINGKKGVSLIEIFDGAGYLLNGNSGAGVYRISRVILYDPETINEIESEKDLRQFDSRGRKAKCSSMVKGEGANGNGPKKWVEPSLNFAKSLQEK